MNIKSASSGKWIFAADQGGTFTDILGMDPNGGIHQNKCLSISSQYTNPIFNSISNILGKTGSEISSEIISEIRIGTTICTNALLERKGSRVGLLTTQGFEDILEIGDQSRPEIFNLIIKKPELLYTSVAGANERINASGEIESPLNRDSVESALQLFKKAEVDCIAILFLHAWKNDVHEKTAKAILKDKGFENIICSSEVIPLAKIVTRGQTTLVDAYLSLAFTQYLQRIQKDFKGIPLKFMMSSGGLSDLGNIRAKDSILSGPSGGAIAAAKTCDQLHIKNGIGFDMGGTSTDVCRYDGTLHRKNETELAGIRYQTDQLDINTVAAGGGSILGFDGQKITVGPESAGALPGPACYGNGGPLTVTDANLILGRILPEAMPYSFGKSRHEQLDIKTAFEAFSVFTKNVNKKLTTSFTKVEIANGFLRIANENMVRAIRKISVAQGYDIRNFTLICFGGAAAQHACGVARLLGMKKIIIHPLSGVLSAYGILCSNESQRKVQSFMKQLNDTPHKKLVNAFKSLESEMTHITGEGTIIVNRFLDVRPLGSDAYLTLDFIEGESMAEVTDNFIRAYKHRFGFIPENSKIEIVNIRSEISKSEDSSVRPFLHPNPLKTVNKGRVINVYFDNKEEETTVHRLDELSSGDVITGPAIIIEPHTTIVIEPGFTAEVNQFNHIEITTIDKQTSFPKTDRDPISLEVFNHRFMGIAEQMGYTLANSAHSVNMKERLDFSCAIFDKRGALVANAPHIPVHLGAMGDSVKTIMTDNKNAFKNGDVFLVNNPHNGGSHLPDITAVSPVYINKQLLFYVATRGHHADIGGIAPGSMPAFATTLEEEGVVIDNFLLVRDGYFRESEISALLSKKPYPARNIPERISDLRAQCAANARGIQALEQLVNEMSREVVEAYMQHIQDNAAEAMDEALNGILGDNNRIEKSFSDRLDDGSNISVSIKIERKNNICGAIIDFSETSKEITGNLNAPVSVVKSAVLYVLRTLINKNIPLNSGCFRHVELIIPKGSLLNPSKTAAVAGGNVETSQRIVDVLLGALGIAAASQGTMNNFTFGNEDGTGSQYYETIAGGAGAIRGHNGASAVQVHMTNTRITDPEVLEQRFPNLRIDRFATRKNSGGKGKWTGGDGVERAIRFLEPMKVSLLTERREYPPYGIEGGEHGKCGANILIKKNGKEISLNGKEELVVNKGETILIKTPGGGGFGKS